MRNLSFRNSGQMLVELLLAIGIASIFLPALITGLVASREGKAQQSQRMEAVALMKEAENVVKGVRDNGWANFAVNGTYHPTISGTTWSLASGDEIVDGFTRQIAVSDVYRDSNGAIVTSGGTLDPSTKRAVITVGWNAPYASAVDSTMYLSRTTPNFSHTDTLQADFSPGTKVQTQVTDEGGGIVKLESNKAKWCSPSFAKNQAGNDITINLPDGPPVAVVAKPGTTTATPNDVFVATAPSTSSTVKLAYINVAANADPPSTDLRGKFTMDPAQYSSGTFPSSTGLDNNFKTNDVKYYTSPSGNLYALLATDLPEKEVIAVQIKNGSNDSFQDSTNRIYKYWTYFNTNIYSGSTATTNFLSPAANVAETSNAGDNDGFQTNPTRAYTGNNSSASDTNSGSGTSTNCTGIDKDKHQFYDYNISLPSSSTIDGIEVRLDAESDSTSNSPQMCVQLSWDGGSTWTVAKTTSTLTTNLQTYTLGSSSDTWGHTWTTSELSNSNFRVRVVNVSSSTSRDFYLDWVAVKVHSNSSGNDYDPYGYGATALDVLGDRGYVSSGGYIYAFDLSNIDSKSSSNGLNLVGCRIEVEGYDCKPNTTPSRKYSAGESGGSWSSTRSPTHSNCSDGGNTEIYATNSIDAVQSGSDTYVFVAVGAGAGEELLIVNATQVPTSSTTPSISSNSCGIDSSTNDQWRRIGTYDFNSSGTSEEAANSVFAKSDGSRAYISSNGGIDADNNGQPDSKQFYILDTTNKFDPKFLSGTEASGATSGFYYGASPNDELFPRKSLTVLDGKRAVLVGKDGFSNTDNALEYQVLDMATPPSSSESTPTYCGGLDFDDGFTGLTSVSESDGDNYVYMVTGGSSNELKIIQGGPDQEYLSPGTFESKTFDAGASVSFNRFLANIDQSNNTTIRFQVAVAPKVDNSCVGVTPFPFIGPDGTSNTYFTSSVNGVTTLTGVIPYGNYLTNTYQNPGMCFRYKAFLTASSDFNNTPKLFDVSWNYSQ